MAVTIMARLEGRITPTGLCVLDPAGTLGVRELALEVTVDGVPQRVRYTTITAVPAGTDAEGPVGASLLRCRTEMRLLPTGAVTVTHTLENPSAREYVLGAIVSGQFDDGAVLLGGGNAMDYRFCHTDNVRTEVYPHCQPEYPYVRPLPRCETTLGIGEDRPFPALFLTTKRYDRGLVIAAAGQETTLQSYTIARHPFGTPGIFATFRIHHELPQTPHFVLDPGASLPLDGIYVQAFGAIHPQDAYVDFLDYVASRFPMRGPTTPLRTEAFFCTWNYGIFADQFEEQLLKTARFTAEHFPNITYFLMDDGYLRRRGRPGFLDQFYPDPDGDVDPEKFPRGIRHFTAALRALGLKPGIWWSPTACLDSPLYAKHPDWFLRDADGGPYRIGANGFLDFTVPAAAQFVDDTLHVVLGAWGMEALKMDFWSHNFEDRDGRLATARQTAMAGRKILFDLVRKHLPPDGVFMTCVAMSMGNPFIGTHADTYRGTIDIGIGDWRHQLDSCCWALPMLGLEGRKTLLLNNDSAGFNLDATDDENVTRLTWMFITQGMQEVGGRLEELPPHYRAALRKFTDRCDCGYRCLCADEAAFTGVPLPAALYVDFPAGSRTRALGVRQNLALFNWSDEPRLVTVRRARLGHTAPVEAENFWTGERTTFADEFITARLDPHAAVLYDIFG